ncbi:hypothetical protein HDU83_006841, partial [Entophlyctis luteolus]
MRREIASLATHTSPILGLERKRERVGKMGKRGFDKVHDKAEGLDGRPSLVRTMGELASYNKELLAKYGGESAPESKMP